MAANAKQLNHIGRTNAVLMFEIYATFKRVCVQSAFRLDSIILWSNTIS